VSILELQDLGIEINGRWLLREISLCFAPGHLTALLGPNGSGKTTLLRLTAGLWSPSSGQVRINKRDLLSIPRRQLARQISFVPQDTQLSFAFTIRDAVAMGRHPHLGRFAREGLRDRRAIEESMDRADVSRLAGRLVTEISGGERQRVIIARCLATEADAILLDEPTASLDIYHTLEILELCKELARGGKTVVFAVHDLNAAARFADHVVLMHNGRIFTHGSPAEVLTDSAVRHVFGVEAERATSSAGESILLFNRPGAGL